MTTKYSGGCLCGNIRFTTSGVPIFPHLCSCKTCQSWSGSPTVPWVEFPLAAFSWTGPGGDPAMYQSSKNTQRGFCPKCGSTLCALDEGYENVSLTIGVFDDPASIIPGEQHSFSESAPEWWKVKVEKN